MTDPRFYRCTQCGALNEPRAVFCSRCGAALPSPAKGPRRRPLTGTSLMMGAALLMGLVILAFVLYVMIASSLDESVDVANYAAQDGIPASTEPPATTAPTNADGTAVNPDGSQQGAAVTTTTEPPVMIRPKAVYASSALKGTSTESFQATNLVDGELRTAWIEGATGPGLGAWVRFEFNKPTVLSRIEIANGYQKDANRFADNPRVHMVNVQYSSGASQLVELYDTDQLQYITPADEAVEWVKLIIISVYSGPDGTEVTDGSVSENTALSEVHIYEKTD